MQTKWQAGQIKDLVIKKLNKHHDQRGFLCETFRLDQLPPGVKPAMSYISYTKSGISRGPHEHLEQTDIFAFTGPGNFLLKLWDNRINSKTYCNYMEIVVGESMPALVVIPPGVVHGYKNISSDIDGMVINYPDKLYKGWQRKEDVDEVRHEEEQNGQFMMD